MSTAQTTNARDPGRWMTLYSVIVAVPARVIDGALLEGVITNFQNSYIAGLALQ